MDTPAPEPEAPLVAPDHDVRRRLAAWDGGAALACTVGAVSLLAYEPSDIGGPLRCLGRFCLASRTWTGD